jgi:hypothetical protein
VAVIKQDTLYLANGSSGATSVALTNYTITTSGAHLQLSGTTHDFTNDVGKLVVIVGAHAGETTGDHLQTVTVAPGTVTAQSTKDVTLTYTGAKFEKRYTGVIAQPQSIPTAGVTWSAFVSAADQVTLRFSNPTTSDVAVATINWDFWLVR